MVKNAACFIVKFEMGYIFYYKKIKKIAKKSSKKIIDLGCLVFSLIVLFYILQSITDLIVGGLNFSRISKGINFLLAALGWYYFSLISFLRISKSSLTKQIILSISSFYFLALLVLIVNHFAQVISFTSQIYSLNYLILFFAILLILIALLINILIEKQRGNKNKINFSNSVPLLILLPLIPGLHIASSNKEYLYDWYSVLYFLILLILNGVTYLWIFATFRNQSNKFKLVVYSSTFVFLFLSLPLLRAVFPSIKLLDFDFWFILALCITITFNIQITNYKKVFTYFLAIVFSISLFNYIFEIFINSKKEILQNKELPECLNNINLNQTPNIYLLVYDGIPNERVFKQHGISFNKLKNLLINFNFKIYSDTYSLGYKSRISMASMLNITELVVSEGHAQDVYSGNSITNLTLRKNGYKTYLLLSNYLTGTYAIKNKFFVDEYFPPKYISSVKKDFFLTLFRGIMQGELNFETRNLMTENYKETAVQKRKNEIIKMQKKKTFVVNHYPLPAHSQNSGKLLPNETLLWIKRFERALIQIEKDVKDIAQYDPNALVIIIGDHGPYLTGDGAELRNFRNKEITNEMIWDRLGTLVSIKWPNQKLAAKYDYNLVLNQDIFAVVFAYLSDNSCPLFLIPDRTFTGFRTIRRPNGIKFYKGRIIE